MFHYSPIPLNSRSRMLIALFLAIALHIGLMNFEFDSRPVLVPSVSLPRSVSVFLGQGNIVEAPAAQTVKTETASHVPDEQKAAEIKPDKSVPQKVARIKEKADNQLQQPALLEKTVRQPAVEKNVPAAQSSDRIATDVKPEQGKAAKAQESVTQTGSGAAQENDGTAQPGTVQTAYPRYQLNTPPAYPGRARKRGQEGTVILRVLVNEEGRVADLEIEDSSGFGLLDRAAVSSVRKWSFEPGRQGEERIAMWVKVPVTFKLKK